MWQTLFAEHKLGAAVAISASVFETMILPGIYCPLMRSELR
jgi:hypothetical protein